MTTSDHTPRAQHPFANTSAKLELLPSPRIDIEEEARLYEDLRSTVSELPPIYKHRPRSRPSPPPPSVLSSDIFLADNTGHPDAKAFAQDVVITGWSTVGDTPPQSAGVKKSLKAAAGASGGAYIVFDCAITTKEGTTINIFKRYNAFAELDHALRRSLPRHLLRSVPTLPPKNPLARFRPAFLDRRRNLLQFWLASVLLHPEIGGTEVVKKWVIT